MGAACVAEPVKAPVASGALEAGAPAATALKLPHAAADEEETGAAPSSCWPAVLLLYCCTAAPGPVPRLVVVVVESEPSSSWEVVAAGPWPDAPAAPALMCEVNMMWCGVM